MQTSPVCVRSTTGDREAIGVTRWLSLVTAEYREMPGLSLTPKQMQRLWSMEETTCEALIHALVAAKVLRRTTGGTYVAHGSAH